MSTTICFDFGNTRKKYAVFHFDEIINIETIETDNEIVAEQIWQKYKPEFVILSSVISNNPIFENFWKEKCNFHKLSIESKLNFTSPAAKPSTIGADRLALCSAAAYFYPNQNCLVIALGSCITYNFINYKAEFLGGAISPGLRMRFKSMNDYTYLLPLVEPKFSLPLIGYDTETNLQVGVQMAIAHEIEGFIKDYYDNYKEFNVVLTGGDLVYFERHLKNRIFADQNFLFKGLYAISKINR